MAWINARNGSIKCPKVDRRVLLFAVTHPNLSGAAFGVLGFTAKRRSVFQGAVVMGHKNRPAEGHARHADNGQSGAPIKNKDYARELKKLHVELVKLQEWTKQEGLKICIVFEGRDGAGKGGVIKAITERVSPRVFRVVALPAPTEREKSQMYLQRYVSYLPAAGEIVIFDRSWYNRAGVERVMGFCTEEQVRRFLEATPLVEKAIVESGVVLLKYWLEVSPDEQTRRLESRIHDGRKIWKLSPMDLKSYSRWFDYSRARDDMFAATDTAWAPWHVVGSDDKKRTQLNVISHLLSRIPCGTVSREEIKLPKRQKDKDYHEPDYSSKRIPEVY
jgi:polyphosphate kinase 2